ncbi:MAG: GTPase HflX [Phycisphaerales bacterium]|nr:GTPase HflX [Phycisphaerales bacterium]
MPAHKERQNNQVQSERTILAAVRLPDSSYDQRDPFGELASLAEQAGGFVVGTLEQRLDRPVAGTYMGSGKVTELRDLCIQLNASMVIFDHELSPRQIANIEEVVGVKILDRSELILDIFASRATTVEAKLQVELAQLEYTYPRLRAMWSHLERIVGAGGIAGVGTRGPGEQQLEIDRRLAQRKELALRARLADIQDRRRREVRQRNVDHFTVGIVGYTNAGKSTLFNTLTPGGAYADDRLFATLTTRTRDWDLGGGVRVLLSDTVGFVRDLPHNLVASFRATLEEATHANLLLIVMDVADPAAELHFDTVNRTLDAIFSEVIDAERRAGIAPDDPQAFHPPQRLLLLNKVDKLRDNKEILIWQNRVELSGGQPLSHSPAAPTTKSSTKRSTPANTNTGPHTGPHTGHYIGVIPIEARNAAHPGMAHLRDLVLQHAQGGVEDLLITVPLSEPRTIHTLETRGTVLARTYSDASPDLPPAVTLHVRIGTRQLSQLRSHGATMHITPHHPPAAPLPKPRSTSRTKPKASKPASKTRAKKG